MPITLTLPEVCYLRSVVKERIEYLKHRINRYNRYMDRDDNVVIYEQRIAILQNELVEMEHIYSELARFISNVVTYSNLMNEFGLVDSETTGLIRGSVK